VGTRRDFCGNCRGRKGDGRRERAARQSRRDNLIYHLKIEEKKLKPTSKSRNAPTSEARQRLAGFIAEKADLVARVESLQNAAHKLAAETAAAAPIEAELQALDSIETESALAWTRAGCVGNPPKTDAKKRLRLNKALVEARAAANAAAAAHITVAAEHVDLSGQIAALSVPMSIEVAAIVAETCEPLIAEFDADNKKLAVKGDRIRQAYDRILGTLDTVRGTEQGRPVAVTLEDLHGRLKRLFATPPHDLDAASQNQIAWRAFSDGLLVDASLKLDANSGENLVKPAPVSIAAIAALRLKAIAAKGL
jgi:hypothetical protein